MKECSTCKKVKRDNDFYTNKKVKSGLSSRCRKCQGVAVRKYEAKNKEKMDVYRSEYRVINSEKIAEYHKEYYNLCKDEILKYQIAYNKEKYATDPIYREKCKIRCKTRYLIKTGKITLNTECQCGETEGLQIHHEHYDQETSAYSVVNICPRCHKNLHRNMARVKKSMKNVKGAK